MFGRVYSAALMGIEGCMVQVEADISSGLPSFDMVGYLGAEVREARERVRTALRNSGYLIPPSRITVNLSPADLRKQGNGFDLPIAVALLTASGYVTEEQTRGTLFAGELSLDGSLKGINGVLSLVSCGAENGMRRAVVPVENGREAAIPPGIQAFCCPSLRDVVDFLHNPQGRDPVPGDEELGVLQESVEGEDFADVSGQEMVKRATEVAAAGMHNILYIGPPGSGKTMVARRIPSILPPLTLEESMELTKVYSVAALLPEGQGLLNRRPFRSPHHTISASALAGGGRIPAPGEVSLADKGVLFLDELPEFHRMALEILRQPLEDKRIVISRVHGTYTFPADFQLVCAMNPCRCGWYPDRNRCRCTETDIRRYLGRISKPLLDRIDICVEAPRVEYRDLIRRKKGESSAAIRSRVVRAMEIQKKRYEGEPILFNSQLGGNKVREFCRLDRAGSKLMERVFAQMELSARAHDKILKVARTIADLEESREILPVHLAEAVGYREMDRKYWGGDV